MELSLSRIRKSYNNGKTYAVDDVTVTFTPGVYGLLGPNGAGKSTLMNIITQNLKPDSGIVALDGVPIARMGADYRSMLGYMPQQQTLYDDFTGERFLWYMAALKGLDKRQARVVIDHTLEVVNLRQERHKKLRSYSGGMSRLRDWTRKNASGYATSSVRCPRTKSCCYPLMWCPTLSLFPKRS